MGGRAAGASQRPRLESASGLAVWREAFAGLDWLSLRTSAVYYGFGVPHGDGSAVVVVPGFLGSDRYLLELYHWLARIGYRPYYSKIGRNADCPDFLLRRLLATIDRAHAETGAKVRLIGHSLGGTLARSAAIRRPQHIAQAITLGSPLRFARVHPAALAAAAVVRQNIHRQRSPSTANGGRRPAACYTESCTCGFVSTVQQTPPPSVARASLYTKTDGVVDWHCCLDESGGLNIEVKSTHCGLAFNPQVYRILARLLAECPTAGHRARPGSPRLGQNGSIRRGATTRKGVRVRSAAI